MDELFSKAIDAFELNEYPSSGAALEGVGVGSRDELISVPPSAVEASQRVLGAWEEIDLEGKKAAWDEQGIIISANQESSTRNRRNLAEQTKAFKSSAGGQKEFSQLLRAYQAEIDSLTKRAKHAEAAYLGVYQLLYDAPDVLPILRSFVEVSARVASAEQDARRMRQELELVRGDAANAKGLHAHIRRLEERNADLEERLAEQVEEAVAAKEKEMFQRVKAEEARHEALSREIGELRENVSSLQKLHDSAQSALFDCKARMEEEVAAKQHELESVLEELERYQSRVAALEADSLSRRTTLVASSEPTTPLACPGTSVTTDGSRLPPVGLSPVSRSLSASAEAASEHKGDDDGSAHDLHMHSQGELAKERLVSRLHAELQQLEQALAAEREARAQDAEAARGILEAAAQEREALQMELLARPTDIQMEELHKQIRILQAMAGTDVYEDSLDAWEDGPRTSTTASEGALHNSIGSKIAAQLGCGEGEEHGAEESEWQRIQAALKDSNKRLQAELTAARTQVAEKTLEAEEAAARAVSFGERCAELQALVAKLEDDIVKGSGSLRELLARRATVSEAWAGEGGSASGIDSLLRSGRASSTGVLSAGLGTVANATVLGPGAAANGTGTAQSGSTLGAAGRNDPQARGDLAAELLSPAHSIAEAAQIQGGGLSDADSMLVIVCDQRERFRKRVKELEEETGRLQDALAKANMEAQRLNTDNLTLYGKIRFLEHYNRQSAGRAWAPTQQQLDPEAGGDSRAGGAAGRILNANTDAALQMPSAAAQVIEFAGAGVRAAARRYSCFGLLGAASGVGDAGSVLGSLGDGAGGGGTETRYRKMYEEKMNPFAEFHQKEQERSYRNLRLHDKITLTSSRFLLSSKYGRMFVFFYTILLHMLVLIILYHSTHPRTSLASANCLPAAPSVLQSPARLWPVPGAAEEDEEAQGGMAGAGARTFADALAEGVGTIMQTTKELTNARSRRRSL